MTRVYWDEFFTGAGKTFFEIGFTSLAAKCVTQLAIPVYNRFCRTESKVEKEEAQNFSNKVAAITAIVMGIALFTYAVLKEKYGNSITVEFFPKFENKNLTERVTGLFSHLMPNRFNQAGYNP